MKIDPQTIEKKQSNYIQIGMNKLFKQVEQHFTQVLLRQLEGRNELYTTEQYVIAKKRKHREKFGMAFGSIQHCSVFFERGAV
ncbi:hypothetical protein GCM10020331_059470 [Ectobacillus funiculus]